MSKFIKKHYIYVYNRAHKTKKMIIHVEKIVIHADCSTDVD